MQILLEGIGLTAARIYQKENACDSRAAGITSNQSES
jgi:hypothetical protein